MCLLLLTVDVDAERSRSGNVDPENAVGGLTPMVNLRLTERTPFAIDDAGDGDDESDSRGDENGNGDRVMDEVQLCRILACCGGC